MNTNFFIYCIKYIHAGVLKRMNIFTYIIVLFIGASVGYFLGTPGVIGMIAGAIVATLISFDMNRKGRSQTSDKVE